MEIKTKFHLGDAVLIRGQRYTVYRIQVEIEKEAPTRILYGGMKVLNKKGRDTQAILDCAYEEDVAADPLGTT